MQRVRFRQHQGEGLCMKKVLIAYFSQQGTTAKAARRIARGFREHGYPVDLYNILKGDPPDVRRYDILGIGSPVYILRPPFNIMGYIETLPRLDGMPFFVFVMESAHTGTAVNTIRRALSRKGGGEVGYTRFLGEVQTMTYLNLGHPLKAFRDSIRA